MNSIDLGAKGKKPYTGFIGCYNSILAQGIAKMLENDPNFYLSDIYSYCENLLNSLEENPPDFCIIDTFFLKCLIHASEDKKKHYNCKILLVEDTHLTQKELRSLIISSRISGIIYKDTNKQNLKKALSKVLSGELWFKRETYEALFNKTKEIIESRIIYKRLLTPTEINVVNLVCQGLKNKEVAEKLFVSESTVKSHLYNIYRKLNINSRTQLMKLYITDV